jgi:hypothetical protein
MNRPLTASRSAAIPRRCRSLYFPLTWASKHIPFPLGQTNGKPRILLAFLLFNVRLSFSVLRSSGKSEVRCSVQLSYGRFSVP